MEKNKLKHEINFDKVYQDLLTDIESIEYFKINKLSISCGKHKWKDMIQSENQITDPSGNQVSVSKEFSGYKVSIMKSGECIYHREFEGESLESKYLALYYTYKDILNAGAQLIHLSFVEQKKMLDEIAWAHANLKPGQKIIH